MRDIGSRLSRRRLTRYAAPSDPVRRGLRWALPILGLWLLWAGFISDHSFLRLWRLGRERARLQTEIERLREDSRRLEAESQDPAAQRALAERALRERNGMARPGEIVYRIPVAPHDTLVTR